MKKLILTSAALLMLAGSTLSVSAATKKAPSQPTKTDVVPGCPYNDPKGCGIFDN